jgi:GNAT superfamily N-acetyltransferase
MLYSACFRLVAEDAHIWPHDSKVCLYLHSLAVRRTVAGRSVASTMLDWAVQYATSQGSDELRLDCWAGNNRLRRYYEDAGFEARGEALVASEAGVDHQDYYVAKFAKKTR